MKIAIVTLIIKSGKEQLLKRSLSGLQYFIRSSLIYNTSARHERHQCDTSDTSATQATRVQQKCDTSGTQVKNFDFDNDTSKNIFSHPYIYYMASERLQGEEQFHSKN